MMKLKNMQTPKSPSGDLGVVNGGQQQETRLRLSDTNSEALCNERKATLLRLVLLPIPAGGLNKNYLKLLRL
jgi:hypothetical protein